MTFSLRFPLPIEPKLKRCTHLFIDSFILAHCCSLLSLSGPAKKEKRQTREANIDSHGSYSCLSFPLLPLIDDFSSWCFHFIVFRLYSYWLFASVCLSYLSSNWAYILCKVKSLAVLLLSHIFVSSAWQKQKKKKDKLLIKTKWIICFSLRRHGIYKK